MSFHKQLVLNRWMYGFFCGGSLSALKGRLADLSIEKGETGKFPASPFHIP